MRCKSGDLAIFLPEGNDPCSSASRGAIVTVDQHHTAYGMVHWSLRAGPFKCLGCGGYSTFLADADLQPLRPGPAKADATVTARTVNNWPETVRHG